MRNYSIAFITSEYLCVEWEGCLTNKCLVRIIGKRNPCCVYGFGNHFMSCLACHIFLRLYYCFFLKLTHVLSRVTIFKNSIYLHLDNITSACYRLALCSPTCLCNLSIYMYICCIYLADVFRTCKLSAYTIVPTDFQYHGSCNLNYLFYFRGMCLACYSIRSDLCQYNISFYTKNMSIRKLYIHIYPSMFILIRPINIPQCNNNLHLWMTDIYYNFHYIKINITSLFPNIGVLIACPSSVCLFVCLSIDF